MSEKYLVACDGSAASERALNFAVAHAKITGASIATILNFKEQFPDSQQLILNISYRSTPQILRACQNLIKHNQKKIERMKTAV